MPPWRNQNMSMRNPMSRAPIEPILVRSRVAQRMSNRAILNEYQCPSCGKEKLATDESAKRSPLCVSCGQTKHGLSRDPRYGVWQQMVLRCKDPSRINFERYGGRGISVCSEWSTFKGFASWNRFSEWKKGLQIDRIDNSKGYSPENCRWVTPKTNARNRRNTKLTQVDVDFIRFMHRNGVPRSEIAEAFSVSKGYVTEVVSGRAWSSDPEQAALGVV